MELQCRVLRFLLVLCIALQLGFCVLAWSSVLPPGFFMQMSATGMSVEAVRALGAGQRMAGAALSLMVLGTLSYGMWRLARMLANVERKRLFDRVTIGHLRAFAGATLASTLLAIVEPPLRTLLFRHAFGDPATGLSIGVSSETLLLILVCGMFYLITSMMHEGRRLAEENEGFV